MDDNWWGGCKWGKMVAFEETGPKIVPVNKILE
jgi:hypothetical protein